MERFMKYLAQPTFTHTIEIKKSEFVVTLFHVETQQDAENEIAQMKKQFPDATHHCSAYLINNEILIKKAYDDGEPSKTAGMPILRSIEYSEFENILVIVTRYFGGIKLGAGGLIRAYSQASREALQLAPAYVPQLFHIVEISGHIQHYGNFNHFIHSQFQISDPQVAFQSDQFLFTSPVSDNDFQHFETLIKNQFHSFTFNVTEKKFM